MASGAVHLMGNLAPVGKRHHTFSLSHYFCSIVETLSFMEFGGVINVSI